MEAREVREPQTWFEALTNAPSGRGRPPPPLPWFLRGLENAEPPQPLHATHAALHVAGTVGFGVFEAVLVVVGAAAIAYEKWSGLRNPEPFPGVVLFVNLLGALGAASVVGWLWYAGLTGLLLVALPKRPTAALFVHSGAFVAALTVAGFGFWPAVAWVTWVSP